MVVLMMDLHVTVFSISFFRDFRFFSNQIKDAPAGRLYDLFDAFRFLQFAVKAADGHFALDFHRHAAVIGGQPERNRGVFAFFEDAADVFGIGLDEIGVIRPGGDGDCFFFDHAHRSFHAFFAVGHEALDFRAFRKRKRADVKQHGERIKRAIFQRNRRACFGFGGIERFVPFPVETDVRFAPEIAFALFLLEKKGARQAHICEGFETVADFVEIVNKPVRAGGQHEMIRRFAAEGRDRHDRQFGFSRRNALPIERKD